MERLTDREGVAGIAMLAMFADGIIRPEEDDVLRARLQEHPLFADASEGEVGRILAKLERASREAGADALLRACCDVVRAEFADQAMALATEIVQADEEVADAERDYLGALQQLLSPLV